MYLDFKIYQKIIKSVSRDYAQILLQDFTILKFL